MLNKADAQLLKIIDIIFVLLSAWRFGKPVLAVVKSQLWLCNVAFHSSLRIIGSLNHEGWKRPQRSSIPTCPTMPTDHIPLCHIPMVFEHLQGWWPFESPLEQLKAITSHPFSPMQGELFHCSSAFPQCSPLGSITLLVQVDPTSSETKMRLRRVCTGAPEVSCSWRDALKEQREQGTACCFPQASTQLCVPGCGSSVSSIWQVQTGGLPGRVAQ